MTKILIIDDESDICFLISEILGDEKFTTKTAHNSNEALLRYHEFNPDLIILDVWLGSSELDGLELLAKFKDLNSLIPIVIISGHGNVDMAVSAIKIGAYDFIEKPFNSDKLIITVKRAFESAKLVKENNQLKSMISADTPLIGNSLFTNNLKKNFSKIAQSNSRILIAGSVGSGKKFISKLIHPNSLYSKSICITIDIKNIKDEELDILFSDSSKNIDKNILSQSNNNTLVLENIDLLNIHYQKKFLFLLENNIFFKKNNINLKQRIITLTTKNLQQEIEIGNFIRPLFDRLSVTILEVPSIKFRREDILPICEYYMAYYNKNKKYKFTFSSNARAKLELYDWPGNISQIINYAEKIIILNQELNINSDFEIDNLPIDMGNNQNKPMVENNFELSLKDARYNFEKDYLLSQIKRFNGNIKNISDFTGMERTALYRKLKALKIDIQKE